MNCECLSELLRNYHVFYGKPLWLAMRPRDSWELIHRFAFPLIGEFAACKDDKQRVWIITDSLCMAKCPDTARALPTAGPELVLFFARNIGVEPERWEISDGWAASVKRLAGLLCDA
jgi:hypothetical protein